MKIKLRDYGNVWIHANEEGNAERISVECEDFESETFSGAMRLADQVFATDDFLVGRNYQPSGWTIIPLPERFAIVPGDDAE
jgi:hypothetical protein